ncbi:hypothetical protein GUITHDRAFT_79938, partial [Guillardia theta CCMP2712]
MPRKLEGDQFEEPEHHLYPKIRLLRVLNWKHVNKIGPGLLNVGNTCFCNAVLQCLTYTPPLANLCKAQEHSKRITRDGQGKFDALKEVERHIITSSRCTQGVLKPSNIVNSFRKIGARLRLGRQEDAHEFTRLLMEAMHLADLAACRFTESPYSRAAQTGLVHGIFGGHLRSQVRCETCRYNSNTYDAFLDLSLEIKKADNITDALRLFTKPEILDGNNKYKCSHCGCKTRATKRFSVHRAPLVLQLHLKRFETSWSGNSCKLSKHVMFEQTLQLDPYMSEGEKAGSRYNLYGVVVHSGHSMKSGHYYAFVKNSNGVWYEMDDDSVRQVSYSAVARQQAYMLFYVQQ